MKLISHYPLRPTVPDAMHTIKDAVEHVFNLIIGKRIQRRYEQQK